MGDEINKPQYWVSSHERYGFSINDNRQLVQRFVQANMKETSKLHITEPLWGEPPVTGGIPSKRVNNVENISMAWRHHANSWNHHKKFSG